ncbi:MAG: hypothetical protein VKN33_06770 [Candidatus Sericytochromatia bacterium]|nr:hypothetical protein [Candidatus Sericytochromatia bacterium]
MRKVLGVVLMGLMQAGCGWYTNIPASILVVSVKPGKITYEPPNTAGVREIKTENPVVRLQGEPGSIGANFSIATVQYTRSNGTDIAADKLPPMRIGLSFRVESSTYPAQPGTGPIDQSQVGRIIDAGRTEIELPVLTRLVEQYGQDNNPPEGNAPLITANVIFQGADDANFPISLSAFVPIYFSGNPGSR